MSERMCWYCDAPEAGHPPREITYGGQGDLDTLSVEVGPPTCPGGVRFETQMLGELGVEFDPPLTKGQHDAVRRLLVSVFRVAGGKYVDEILWDTSAWYADFESGAVGWKVIGRTRLPE